MRILIISSFIPFPPTSGARIRTWEMALRMQRTHDVTFAVHVRSVADLDRAQEMRLHGFNVITGWINTGMRALYTALFEFVSGGVPLFAIRRSHDLEQQLRGIHAATPFDIIQVEHFELARYAGLIGRSAETVHSIILHDVLSAAYARMAAIERNPFWRIWRSYNSWRLARYEQLLLAGYDLCVTVSTVDSALISRWIAPGTKVHVSANCVDSEAKPYLDAPESGPPALLFVGLFLHPPNADAGRWMAEEIFPLVRAVYPDCRLILVGADPTHQLMAAKQSSWPGVTHVGQVKYLAPYYRQCDLAVVPLRSGGGTRLKILEAMAYGRAVVATTLGAEGLEASDGEHLVLADGTEGFARAVIDLLADDLRRDRVRQSARGLVERNYSWDESTQALLTIYSQLAATKAAAHQRLV